MAVPLRLLLAPLAALACAGHPDTTSGTETSPAASCGPDGYSLPDALPGDSFVATDPAIRSVVVSNGDVQGVIASGWSGTVVSRTSATVPLVIQLRDIDHRTLCSGLN